jgi:hypothetical protein
MSIPEFVARLLSVFVRIDVVTRASLRHLQVLFYKFSRGLYKGFYRLLEADNSMFYISSFS